MNDRLRGNASLLMVVFGSVLGAIGFVLMSTTQTALKFAVRMERISEERDLKRLLQGSTSCDNTTLHQPASCGTNQQITLYSPSNVPLFPASGSYMDAGPALFRAFCSGIPGAFLVEYRRQQSTDWKPLFPPGSELNCSAAAPPSSSYLAGPYHAKYSRDILSGMLASYVNCGVTQSTIPGGSACASGTTFPLTLSPHTALARYYETQAGQAKLMYRFTVRGVCTGTPGTYRYEFKDHLETNFQSIYPAKFAGPCTAAPYLWKVQTP